MSHLPGDTFGATDLFFGWTLGLTVFAGGLGDEQLTINNNNAGKIFLIIIIVFELKIYTKCLDAMGNPGSLCGAVVNAYCQFFSQPFSSIKIHHLKGHIFCLIRIR